MNLFKLNICILVCFIAVNVNADLFCNREYWRNTTQPDVEYMLNSQEYDQIQDEQQLIYDLTFLYEECEEGQEKPIQILKREASLDVQKYLMCEITSEVNSLNAFFTRIMDPWYWTGCILYELRESCEQEAISSSIGGKLVCQEPLVRWNSVFGGGSR